MSQVSPIFRPLYRQIKQLLLQSLEVGEWRPGDAIPSETDLAARFAVSQGTVRKAIDEMASENLLVRKQGKGTFVASHGDDQRTSFRFLRLVPLSGEQVASQSVPLECWRAKAGAEAARVLKIEAGAPVIILRRVLQFSRKPIVLDDIYLPGEMFHGLSLELLQENQGSLYSLFETKFGVCIVRAEERLRAVSAERVSAEALQVAEGTPLLSAERVTYTYGDKPVEWRRGLFLTDDYCYFNQLS